MTTGPMAVAPTLRVRRHDVSCRVANQSSSMVAARLADDTHEQVVEHLAAQIGALDTTGVLLIRRLDVRVMVPATAVAGDAARAIAGEIVAGLGRVASAGPDGDNVAWYPDGGALLQRYFGDLIDGLADGRWEYRTLGHDPSLPAAKLVLKQFRDRPNESLAALRRMQHRSSAVILVFDDVDAAAALPALASADEPGAGDPCAALAAAADGLRTDSQLRGGATTVTLQLFVRSVVIGGADATVDTARRATEAGHALVALRGLPATDVMRVAAAVVHGAWESIDRSLVDNLAPLATWPAADAHALVTAAVRPGAAPAPAAADDGVTMRTSLGGMFLLLPYAAEVPLIAAAHQWPPCNGTDAVRVAALLVTISALGAECSEAGAADSVLRLATGVPSNLQAVALSGWADQCVGSAVPTPDGPPLPGAESSIERATGLAAPFTVGAATNAAFAAAGRHLLRALAARLPGLERSSGAYLWRNILDFPASVELTPDRNIVRIGRPPLHLLLAMTGLDRQQFVLPDDRGMAWVLTLEE